MTYVNEFIFAFKFTLVVVIFILDVFHFDEVLTASNIWKVFGTQRAQNEIIYEKCNDIDVNKFSNVNTESPMHWGQKYEPVSIEWYEAKYKTKVSDFGCIPHQRYKFLLLHQTVL